jgi:hypothetical protein
MKNIMVLILSIISIGCSYQYRLDFDPSQNSFKRCYKDLPIKELFIVDSLDVVYSLSLIRGEKGSSIIYLCRENPGYNSLTNDVFHFRPNTKYTVYSTDMDSGVIIILFTDENATVDSVINNYRCQ